MPLTLANLASLTNNTCHSLEALTQATDLSIQIKRESPEQIIAFFKELAECHSLRDLQLEIESRCIRSKEERISLFTCLRQIAPQLESFGLDLQNTLSNKSANTIRLLDRVAFHIAPRLTQVTRLTLKSNMLEQDDIEEEDKRIYIYGREVSCGDAFVRFLKRFPNKNQLTDLALAPFLTLISSQEDYTNTDIDSHPRSRDFLNALRECTSLNTFSITQANFIGQSVQQAIGKWISSHRALQTIKLSFQFARGDLDCLLLALKNQRLKQIEFVETRICDLTDDDSTSYDSTQEQLKQLGNQLASHISLEKFSFDVDFDFDAEDEELRCILPDLIEPLLNSQSIKTLSVDPFSLRPGIDRARLETAFRNNHCIIEWTSSGLSPELISEVTARNQRHMALVSSSDIANVSEIVHGMTNQALISLQPYLFIAIRRNFCSLHTNVPREADYEFKQAQLNRMIQQFMQMLPRKCPTLGEDPSLEVMSYLTDEEFKKISVITGGLFFRERKNNPSMIGPIDAVRPDATGASYRLDTP